MNKLLRLVSVLFVCMLPIRASGAVTTIDFEQFEVGDSLATVNAALAPLGVTFDADFPASFEVVLDPGNAANKVIRAQPPGAVGAVNFVANFSQAVESVSVEFVTNPDLVTVIVLDGYTANQSASAVNIADFAMQASAFVASGTLTINWTDVFAPPSQLRAATMGAASPGLPRYNYIDNLSFVVLVPEPGCTVFLVCGLAAAFGRRRRRR